jgi:hypothetical protein
MQERGLEPRWTYEILGKNRCFKTVFGSVFGTLGRSGASDRYGSGILAG